MRKKSSKLKKAIVAAAVGASGFGVQQAAVERDLVVMPPIGVPAATVSAGIQALDASADTTPRTAYRVRTSYARKWRTSLPVGTIVEPVFTYQHQAGCSRDPIPPPVPPPVDENAPDLEMLDWGVERVKAQPVAAEANGRGIRVCILDTGIDKAHPDLKYSKGRDFTSLDPDDFQDRHNHGSHVAGLIAARRSNRIGVYGTSEADLLIAKVLSDDGWGTNEGICNGVTWCVEEEADIISASLGGPDRSEALEACFQYASDRGVISVIAAGNDGSSTRSYPAGYDIPELYSVSAIGKDGRLASFSNWGNHIALACPGVDILSTVRGGRYARMSGTSMATPICAGAIADALQAGRELRFGDLGRSDFYGKGIPDLVRTMSAE